VWELVKAGGWPMVPLLLLGVLALAIILERFWSLRRTEVLPPGLGQEVRNWAARGKLDPAHLQTLRANSPLGALLAAALEARNRPRDQIRERIEDTGRHLVHRMERFLNALGTIASAGPLLGLLGTVSGMIAVFDVLATNGSDNPRGMAAGVWQATLPTMAGMVLAITGLFSLARLERNARLALERLADQLRHD